MLLPNVADQWESAATASDSPVLVKLAAEGAIGRFKFDLASPTFFVLSNRTTIEFVLPPHVDLYVSSSTAQVVSVLLLPPTPD